MTVKERFASARARKLITWVLTSLGKEPRQLLWVGLHATCVKIIISGKTNLNYCVTSMLLPGDPGRLGTPIYVFTGESPQPVGARHTSLTPLLWKPHDRSREDTPLYLVTFETSRLLGARNTSCKQLLWKPRDPSRDGAPIYLVTFETSRPTGQGTVHVSNYCGNPAIQAGKAHPFT
jgi:hypothetical protein